MAKRTSAAVDMILRMAAEGHAHRVIARVLVESGFTTPKGAQWTHKQVGRVCERHQRRLEKATEKADAARLERERQASLPRPDYVDLLRRRMRRVAVGVEWDDDNGGYQVVDAPFTGTDEEWKKLTEDVDKEVALRQEERAARDAHPRDWKTLKGLELFADWREHYKSQRFGQLNNLVGGETWHHYIFPLVVEHTRTTGRPVMRLLDSITDQPDVKAMLRMLWFGVLEELAMTRETVLALREQAKDAKATADYAMSELRELRQRQI